MAQNQPVASKYVEVMIVWSRGRPPCLTVSCGPRVKYMIFMKIDIVYKNILHVAFDDKY